jgi:hypothetical protein
VISNCAIAVSTVFIASARSSRSLRAGHDVAQLVGLGRNREARLFLLKLGKALEFLIGQKFRHEIGSPGCDPRDRAPDGIEEGRHSNRFARRGSSRARVRKGRNVVRVSRAKPGRL